MVPLFPSITVTSSIRICGEASSFVIVAVAVVLVSVAPLGFESWSWKLSVGSKIRSPFTNTVKVTDSVLAGIVTVPEAVA